MKIDSVEFFYASMPTVTLEADGSQDALLVRVAGDDGSVGWGECEASPLTSIAAFVTPRSHGVCQPVSASVIGEAVDSPADIARIAALVGRNSMDLLQAAHTWSGIEIALWDLLGRRREVPVWQMLGYRASHGKTPYASMLFGDTPDDTLERVRAVRARGYSAVKLGWGAYGIGSVTDDADQVAAAREGLGADGTLLVDAGQIWGDDIERAASRLDALKVAHATWLEEPFYAHSYAAHAELVRRAGSVGIAGGEGAHTIHMATNLIDFGGVSFVQVDAARIGGIGPAKIVADHAVNRGVTFVNHTFTSHLALSASLQPFAGLADHRICEYPVESKEVSQVLTTARIEIDADGQVRAPDAPGLGMEVDLDALAPYLRTVELLVDDAPVYKSPYGPGAAPRVKKTTPAVSAGI